MKKKEVIYYEGNAFPSPVDDRVELKKAIKVSSVMVLKFNYLKQN